MVCTKYWNYAVYVHVYWQIKTEYGAIEIELNAFVVFFL